MKYFTVKLINQPLGDKYNYMYDFLPMLRIKHESVMAIIIV